MKNPQLLQLIRNGSDGRSQKESASRPMSQDAFQIDSSELYWSRTSDPYPVKVML